MVSDRTSTTVDEYLDQVDPERVETMTSVRDLVRSNLQPGFAEEMLYGMPTYVVPLERYPDTYNAKPLAYISFAAQKQYNSLYLMCLYTDSEEERSFARRWAGGKKLNMGKSCVRFKQLPDLDLPLIAETIASTSVEQFIEMYERVHPR